MKRLHLFLFVLFMLSVIGFSQKKTDTLHLYYAINETESQQNFTRIDSAIKALNGKLLDVAIYGYADFLSPDDYNIQLSKKRAEVVKNYLLQKTVPSQINIYAWEGKGEKFSKDNSDPLGDFKQRRVDIYFEPIVIINVSEARLQDPSPPVEKSKEKLKEVKAKKVEELEVGESVSMDGLNFEPGRHILRKESIEPLKRLLSTMEENKSLKIEIQGHVCCIGGELDGNDFDTHENKLSENRAHAIYSYLLAKGIDSARVSYKGFGGSHPKIWPEKSSEDQQVNRRVEIKILSK